MLRGGAARETHSEIEGDDDLSHHVTLVGTGLVFSMRV